MNRAQKGFTLVEMVLVIIIISVASVPLFSLFSQASISLLSNEAIQTAAQLAQERAEFVLSRKRELGLNGPVAELAVGPPITENLTGNFDIFNRSTGITSLPGGTGACPSVVPCKQVVVSVDAGGPTLAQITFLLVDY